jgi:hypothetical protein
MLSPERELNKHEKNNHSNDSRGLNEVEKNIEVDILSVIEGENIYLEPKFNWEDLASRLELNRPKVSKIINAKENGTFYDSINGIG